jgi:hypothetical protein
VVHHQRQASDLRHRRPGSRRRRLSLHRAGEGRRSPTSRSPTAKSGRFASRKKFEQGEDVFRARRSLFFKKMQIVRNCDTKRNVLVYMVYSDKLIEGSPKNSTSSVPVMPWGAGDEAQKCANWVE